MLYEEILTRQEAIDTILYIGDNPGKTKSEIMYRDGRDERGFARFRRIKDALDYGLAEVRSDDEQMLIYLTDKGTKVYEHLKGLCDILNTLKAPIFEEI